MRFDRSGRFAALLLVLGTGSLGGGCTSEPGLAPFGGGCPPEQAAQCRASQRGCAPEADAFACLDCGERFRATSDGVCEPIEGERLHHRFDDFTTTAGEEVTGICQSWTLGNETEIFVHAVELTQDQGGHHSNWTFVPDRFYDGPDGTWPCDEREYTELTAAVRGGVLYAQSTQATHEVQHFAPGAVIRLPPHARIIGDVHIINYAGAPVTGHAEMSLYLTPADEVRTVLTPFRLNLSTLSIPARSGVRNQTTCELAPVFQRITASGVDMRLHYALPHTHGLGTRVFLQATGGPLDGTFLIDSMGVNGEALGTVLDPPVDLTGVDGLVFGCEYQNPRDEAVGLRIGNPEMGVMPGLVESPVRGAAHGTDIAPAGEADGLPLFDAPCDVLAVPNR